ncbi:MULTISPECIES: helix-turn-helix domain-containing protein [Rhodomicrobium]|uniref:helix-turn-helix domain-containing protein n=1 Tax=Rhodomicrobium vannielii TaxID=1069 RepID=UPI000B4BA619
MSDLERGLRNPTLVTIYEIAIALGVSHMEIVMPDQIEDAGSPVTDAPPAQKS